MDLFNERNPGTAAPSMLLGANAVGNTGFNPAEYRYRVARFELGSQDTNDEAAVLETLLDRSLTPEVFIMERKDSISATTGVYSCIIVYLERRAEAQGE